MEGTGSPPAPLRVLRGSEVPPRRQIALGIAGRIHDGAYGPGRRLPSVRALGERLDVHRDTVLAAYRELERAGLVRAVPGGGVFVTNPVPPLSELVDPGVAGLGLRLASLGAAVRLRRVLVLADEPALGNVLGRELRTLLVRARVRVREATAAPLPGLDFGWLPVHARLGAGSGEATALVAERDGSGTRHEAALRPLRLTVGLGGGLMERLAALRFPDVVGVVSASAAVRELVRESVRAAGGPDVGVVSAAPGDGREMRRVRARATLVLTDASVRTMAAASNGRRRRCRLRVQLVPAAFASELLDLFGREAMEAGVGS